MTRRYKRCGNLRVTSTTMVFFILVEITLPITVLRRELVLLGWAVLSGMLLVLRLCLRRQFLLAQNRLHPGNVLAQGANLFQAFCLAHLQLEAQAEELVSQLPLLMLQLHVGQVANYLCLHKSVPGCQLSVFSTS